MNIDEMPAGQEMDALIAEKVMGWKRRKRGGGWLKHGRATESICPECGEGQFHPSRDIAAAWKVVEKCRENGLVVYVDEIDLVNPHKWRCTLKQKAEDGCCSWFEDYDDDTALAICRAALKFMEQQRGD